MNNYFQFITYYIKVFVYSHQQANPTTNLTISDTQMLQARNLMLSHSLKTYTSSQTYVASQYSKYKEANHAIWKANQKRKQKMKQTVLKINVVIRCILPSTSFEHKIKNNNLKKIILRILKKMLKNTPDRRKREL